MLGKTGAQLLISNGNRTSNSIITTIIRSIITITSRIITISSNGNRGNNIRSIIIKWSKWSVKIPIHKSMRLKLGIYRTGRKKSRNKSRKRSF